jgi:hypothetical protein
MSQDYANGVQIQQDGHTVISAPEVIDFGSGITVEETPAGTAKVDFGGGETPVIPKATTTVYGIAKLSVAAEDAEDPVVVGDNDERNTNNRYPTAHHTSHEEGGDDVIEFAQSQITNLETDLSNRIQGYGFYGTGSDGDVTLTENITLTRDMHYDTVTADVDITINLAGFRFFAWEVKGTGTITLSDKGGNGGNATATLGGTAATPRAAGYLPAPTVGKNGGAVNTNGIAGTAVSSSLGSSGIAGKDSATKTGGAAGAATALSATSGGMRNFNNLSLFRAFTSTSLVTPTGHAGNGSSAGGTTGGGGASGNNGGYALVFIRTITSNIIIDARGGTGGNGYGNGAGGNGGNGGIIGLIYHIVGDDGSITCNYTGGTGGTGSTAGATGNTGVLITLVI